MSEKNNPNARHKETWMTAEQLADYLAISMATVRKWTRTGVVPCHRLAGGRSIRFERHEIDQWIRNDDHDR